METPQTVKKYTWRLTEETDNQHQSAYYRLGLLNGLLIGLAISAGAWGWEVVTLSELPVTSPYPRLLLGGGLVIIICSVAGWLTTRLGSGGRAVIGWLVAATLSLRVMAFVPYQGRSLFTGLIDGRFVGLPVYIRPAGELPLWMVMYGGFFALLLLVLLALLQEYRLDGIHRERRKNGRLSFQSWFRLLLPLPVIAITAAFANQSIGDASWRDLQLVAWGIEGSRTAQTDLFDLSRQEGLNYNAFRGLQTQLTADYVLDIGETDTTNGTTFVVAHFDNGAWITCRVVYGQLSYCYDASPPYTVGLRGLITGEEPAEETCRGCVPRISAEWLNWLEVNRGRFGNPTLSFVAQQGAYVLVQVTSEDGAYEVLCRLYGVQAVRFQGCVEQ